MLHSLGNLELRTPPLPHTIVEALDLLDHPERLDPGTVTEMVERDPLVVARVLQNVNSAYYGLRRTITSVERAVILIGPVAVTGIIVGMNMLRLRSVVKTSAAPYYLHLVKHSLATAFLARHLDEGPPRLRRSMLQETQPNGIAFTAGLLHDFGKIILVYNYPEQSLALYQRGMAQQNFAEPDSRRIEALLFGCDHTEAGEYAARKLNFPDILTSAIQHHHDTPQQRAKLDSPVRDLLVLVEAANLAAAALGYGSGPQLSWYTLSQNPVWERLLAMRAGAESSVAELIDELKLQQPHLDAYITPMAQWSET